MAVEIIHDQISMKDSWRDSPPLDYKSDTQLTVLPMPSPIIWGAFTTWLGTPVTLDQPLSYPFQIRKAFDKEHSKRKSVKQLPESDIIRIVEEVCWDKFEQWAKVFCYTLLEINISNLSLFDYSQASMQGEGWGGGGGGCRGTNVFH